MKIILITIFTFGTFIELNCFAKKNNPPNTKNNSVLRGNKNAPNFTQSIDNTFQKEKSGDPSNTIELRDPESPAAIFSSPKAEPLNASANLSPEPCCKNLNQIHSPFMATELGGANLWTRNGRFFDYTEKDGAEQ